LVFHRTQTFRHFASVSRESEFRNKVVVNDPMAESDDDDELARNFADNETNKSIDALFIVAQHDGCKWADECGRVKDLCRATRAETGLWSALSRVHYGPWKRTLLMYEADHGRLERVQWLLARGAPVDAGDHFGTTALNKAISIGHSDIVRALIEAGADVDILDDEGESLETRASPLYEACFSGHVHIVRALIEAGADVDIGQGCESPLWCASAEGHIDIVRELIAAGAEVNLTTANDRTALDAAIHFSHESTINALIEAGATTASWDDESLHIHCDQQRGGWECDW
jgi:ankyrin repeat protein